jgi:aminoglycoside phosphotransferase (APT) family kinase protein
VTGVTWLDTQAVAEHLEAVGLDLAGPLRSELIAGGRSNLTYRLSDGQSRWVLRRPPQAGRTASAHDMVREARVTAGLADTAVPVPPLVSLCEDESVLGVPFTVTGWIDGRVVRQRSDLTDLTDHELIATCAALVDVLATLHEIDPQEVGLSGFGRAQGYLERQVALWRRQWEQVHTRELADLERLHIRLADRVPTSAATSIVHGDYRIDNVMLAADDPAQVMAVLDWELSTLGDPCTDVALMCTYRHPALDAVLGIPAAWASPRLPAPESLADAYARRSGRDLGDWAFYLGLAHLKLAVIAEGIAYRASVGADAGREARGAAAAVPELLADGLSHLG